MRSRRLLGSFKGKLCLVDTLKSCDAIRPMTPPNSRTQGSHHGAMQHQDVFLFPLFLEDRNIREEASTPKKFGLHDNLGSQDLTGSIVPWTLKLNSFVASQSPHVNHHY